MKRCTAIHKFDVIEFMKYVGIEKKNNIECFLYKHMLIFACEAMIKKYIYT